MFVFDIFFSVVKSFGTSGCVEQESCGENDE